MTPRIYQLNGIYYADIRINGKRTRQSLRTSDPDEAQRLALEAAEKVEAAPHPSTKVAAPVDLSRRLQRIRERSKRRGHECDLSREDLERLLKRAGGRCEVSGIPFSDWKEPGWDKAPFAPTIDRINSQGRYTPRNCRVVCQAVNIALNEWGYEVFMQVVEGTKRAHLERHSPETRMDACSHSPS